MRNDASLFVRRAISFGFLFLSFPIALCAIASSISFIHSFSFIAPHSHSANNVHRCNVRMHNTQCKNTTIEYNSPFYIFNDRI